MIHKLWIVVTQVSACLVAGVIPAPGAGHSTTSPDPDCQIASVLKAHDPPLVFDLESDPSENYPLSLDTEPDLHGLLDMILEAKAKFEASMVFGESQVERGSDPALAPCCAPLCHPKPSCCQCWHLAFGPGVPNYWIVIKTQKNSFLTLTEC